MRILLIATTAALGLAATGAIAQSGGRPLTATLSGAEEVPGPGDTDGSGEARITVNPGKGEICYSLKVSGIEPARAAHIHDGDKGTAGPVVVTLTAPTSGTSAGCATVSREQALEIVKDPSGYYVNVHNAPFPGGAVRGQLGK